MSEDIFTLPDGTRVKRLKNGTLYDMDKKRFHSGPDEEHRIQPGDHARTLALRRNALARERAREGALLAALETCPDDVHEETDAWRAILRARARVALRDDSRAGNEAARLVGRATGWMSEEHERDDSERARAPDLGALLELARALDDELERRVTRALAIDANVIE